MFAVFSYDFLVIFHDFAISWKVIAWQVTTKTGLGDARRSLDAPQIMAGWLAGWSEKSYEIGNVLVFLCFSLFFLVFLCFFPYFWLIIGLMISLNWLINTLEVLLILLSVN